MTMNLRNGFSGTGRQRGIAIVEMVIVLPVILLLMLMVAEFGRVFYQYSTLNKAVRDGARYVAGTAVFGSTGTIQLTSTVVNETKSIVTTGTVGGTASLLPGLTASDVTLATAGPGNIQVTATYTFQPIFDVLPGFGATGNRSLAFTLTASNVMKVL